MAVNTERERERERERESAGGRDGLRPQHLRDMVLCKETGPELITDLTGFIKFSFRRSLYHGDCSGILWKFSPGVELVNLEQICYKLILAPYYLFITCG